MFLLVTRPQRRGLLDNHERVHIYREACAEKRLVKSKTCLGIRGYMREGALMLQEADVYVHMAHVVVVSDRVTRPQGRPQPTTTLHNLINSNNHVTAIDAESPERFRES